MISCYDTIDDKFTCQLQKIKCAFADRVFADYRQLRYGIKSCDIKYSIELLSDLKELMEYIESTDISGFDQNTYRNRILTNDTLQEQVNNGCIPPFMVETLKICNLSNLIEKINSL